MLNIPVKELNQKVFNKNNFYNGSENLGRSTCSDLCLEYHKYFSQENLTKDSECQDIQTRFFRESDPFYLHEFLNISSKWNNLFDKSFFRRLIKFSSEKLLFGLWCKLANSISCFEYEELLVELTRFENFINIIERNHIADSKIYNFQQFTDLQFSNFIEILVKSENKLLQITHAFPPIHDINKGLELLEKGYIFINEDIVNLSIHISADRNLSPYMLLERILQTGEVKPLCNLIIFYLLNYNVNLIEEFCICLDMLNQSYNERKFSAQAFLIIVKLILQFIYHQNPQSAIFSDIKYIFNHSIKFYEIFGDKLFYILEQQVVNSDTLAIIQETYNLLDYFSKRKMYINLNEYSTIDNLLIEVEKIKLGYIKSQNQTRDLDVILSDFKGPNSNVKFPLDNKELSLIKEQFILIEKFELQLASMPLARLNTLIMEIKEQLHYGNSIVSNSFKQELICQLVAIAMRAFIQFFDIYPYDVQRLSVLAMLLPRANFKGALAQVKTGEGKSTIVTLLTLILACQGKTVDIITSTEYLAKRDEKKYKGFFEFFGVPTNNICDKNINKENFAGQVIYGTNYDFEFSILWDKLYLLGNRVDHLDSSKPRRLQVAIIDEVDNMLVDKALNSARISFASKENLEALYVSLYDFVKISCSGKKPDEVTKVHCRKLANEYEISDIRLQKLINSAYEACFEYHLNTHYCIKKPVDGKENSSFNIVIVDRDTGRLNEGSRWQNGLHQFLEHKHGLPIKEDTKTIGALSHPAFFSYYEEIYGVTGTIGSQIERMEVEKIYNVASFDVPTYKPTLRKQLDSVICENKNEFEILLIKEVKMTLECGRPCLILCSSIEESKAIYTLLKVKTFNTAIQLLNDTQYHDEEFIVSNAGGCSSVTIATNAAGRGTDIEIRKNALKNGGLHVIFTFFPHNERVEAQGAGRAGRQGNPGSYKILIPHDDDLLVKVVDNQNKMLQFISSILFNRDKDERGNLLPSNVSIENLYEFREQLILKASSSRQISSQVSLIRHKIFEKFCDHYSVSATLQDFNRHQVLSKWAEFYTNLEDIPIPNFSDNIDENKELLEYSNNLDKSFREFSIHNFSLLVGDSA